MAISDANRSHRSRARNRALSRLAYKYPEEYRELYKNELGKAGTVKVGGPEFESPTHNVTPGDAAMFLGVTREPLNTYIRRGKLTVIRTPGGHRRYSEQELKALKREASRR